ncbi:MAG: hypothetical protein E7653_06005 [Ruminococcaceae bacterium]|nr:hypothetical protein [Oscillospiraceae bacterium]
MKFFHVYNDECFAGLEKNGMINGDTGFKIQHCFAVPKDKTFNYFAAEGSRLYQMIKQDNIPFYVDRIAGGITWYPYEFDKLLIGKYREMLGDWFLGFQLHESGSNRRRQDWARLRRVGGDGPYDVALLDKELLRPYAVTPDKKVLHGLSQESIYFYANKTYARTHEEFIDEFKELFACRMADTDNCILPCDSYYLAAYLEDKAGMKTFMPEVGAQIPLMCVAVALARGQANASGKTWGTYYECWSASKEHGYTMPVFNTTLKNEWYLTQETHKDDFTTYGKNGGSSRLLQNRIYYYSLMAGAHYMSEEWGLNCSYNDMTTFELSEYGQVKKNFINNAMKFRGIKARVPFAVVLPKRYSVVQINTDVLKGALGEHRDTYLEAPLDAEEKRYFGHIEDVIKLLFAYSERYDGDNEDHVMTNTRFGDVFDILYEDASDDALSRYEYLIDASVDGDFASERQGSGLRIIESGDIEKLEAVISTLTKQTLDCYVDGLLWLVSADENGKRYLSIFNNAGNRRDAVTGDSINQEATKCVTVTFKQNAVPKKLVEGVDMPVDIIRVDGKTYKVRVPATGFVILEF